MDSYFQFIWNLSEFSSFFLFEKSSYFRAESKSLKLNIFSSIKSGAREWNTEEWQQNILEALEYLS